MRSRRVRNHGKSVEEEDQEFEELSSVNMKVTNVTLWSTLTIAAQDGHVMMSTVRSRTSAITHQRVSVSAFYDDSTAFYCNSDKRRRRKRL